MIGELLPNSAAGTTTETVGFFACEATTLVDWLVPTLGIGWSARVVGADRISSQLHLVPAGGPVSKYFVLDLGDWVAVFSDGPTGTDLGVLPSRAARDLAVTAIRRLRLTRRATRSAPQLLRCSIHGRAILSGAFVGSMPQRTADVGPLVSGAIGFRSRTSSGTPGR